MEAGEAAEPTIAQAIWEAAERHVRQTLACFTSDQLEARRPGGLASLTASGEVLMLGGRSFPVFQFDDDLEVIEVVAEINRLLDAKDEPAAAATWWATRHARLGAAPYSLANDPGAADRLRRAAAATLSKDY